MKHFITKLTIFLLFIYLGQIIIYVLWNQRNSDNKYLLKKHIEEKISVIGFGDSSILFAFEKEQNKDSTYTILRDLIEDDQIQEILHPAYHLELYEHLFRYIALNNHFVKQVLIPINLRSFSPQWDKAPNYRFKTEMLLLNDKGGFFEIFFKPLSVFKLFDSKRMISEYKNSPVIINGREVGKVNDFLTENYENVNFETITTGSEFISINSEFIKDKFMFHYMCDFNIKHKKLESIRNIIRLGKKYNIQPIFFIVPIDYINGNKYVGPQFEAQIKKNTDIIKELFEEEREALLDLSTSLHSNYFYWYRDEKAEYTPNEHLLYEGKRFVAEQLYNFIQSLPKHH